jgi:hypothetical protein
MGQEWNEKCFLSTDQSIHPSILHGVLVAATSLCSKEGSGQAGELLATCHYLLLTHK